MKITKAFIFVTLDDETQPRQVYIKKEYQQQLITLIEAGMFHDGKVTISDYVLEALVVEK